MVAAATLFPFIWMVSTSLKDTSLVFSYPPKLIPNPARFQNYADAWEQSQMGRALFNSMFIAVISTAGNIIVSSMVAYAFAKIDFRFKSLLFMLVLATVMIPYQVTLIPLFIIFKNLGWINTYLPLIVPSLFGTASNVFLMRQYIMGIPDAYRDSAYLDGCGHMRIWLRIILPMSVPMVVSISVLTFMGKWNEFLGPHALPQLPRQDDGADGAAHLSVRIRDQVEPADGGVLYRAFADHRPVSDFAKVHHQRYHARRNQRLNALIEKRREPK